MVEEIFDSASCIIGNASSENIVCLPSFFPPFKEAHEPARLQARQNCEDVHRIENESCLALPPSFTVILFRRLLN